MEYLNIDKPKEEAEALVDATKEWIELRLEKTKVEVEYEINFLLTRIVEAVLWIFALFFVLITVALAIGFWLGEMLYGFLIVMCILALALFALIVILRRKPLNFWQFSDRVEFWNRGVVGRFLKTTSELKKNLKKSNNSIEK